MSSEDFDPDRPSIEIMFPEDGDAVILFPNPDMHEGEDGDLTPCAFLNPLMAGEIGKRLIAWDVQREDAVVERAEED